MRPGKSHRYSLGLLAIASLPLLWTRVATYDAELFASTYDQTPESLVSISAAWWVLALVVAIIVAADAIISRRKGFAVKREAPSSAALGVAGQMVLSVKNTQNSTLYVEILDNCPVTLGCDSFPLKVSINANSHKAIKYGFTPTERGDMTVPSTTVYVRSWLGFWWFKSTVENKSVVKVYPNYGPMMSSAAISLEHQLGLMGLHMQRQRGAGSDFRQLREFREGDSLKQIDWNATARHLKPISREYQEEKDQEVVFLLDCGRNLRARDGDISHFDHALNALLLCSYVAMRQGDAAGFLASNESHRWVMPLKSPQNVNVILNQLYDLQSSGTCSDYVEQAQEFLKRYRRQRSLVVFITQAKEEDFESLSQACALLTKTHLVMVANVKDAELKENMVEPTTVEAAVTQCAQAEYDELRFQALAKLRQNGVIIADDYAANLHYRLVQEYLLLKRTGQF